MSATGIETAPQVADHFALHGVSWRLYEMLLREIGDQHIYVTYDNGDLELMSPSPEHERWKTLIGRMIEILSLELDVPVASLGSTTFKRKDLKKGLEPDECYYLQHEAQVRGKDKIDLPHDPPPDLVVEIDIRPRAIKRESICASLGVPEIWQFDGDRLIGLALQQDGRYARIERSLVFPFLQFEDLQRFLHMVPAEGETGAMRAFRDWVRTTVI